MLGKDTIARMAPPALRMALPRWAANHVTEPVAAQVATDVTAALAHVSDEALASLVAAYGSVGEDWTYYPAHPAARAMMRVLMHRLVPRPSIEGVAALEAFVAAPARRKLIVANHLSYIDTQVTDVVLARSGYEALADRIVAVAGPKVYTDAWRRLAALGLNTRKTVQSAAVATEQDLLPARELAAIARDTVSACETLMDEGHVVLLYPEGTRSRDGRLQPFLRAVGRYLASPDTMVLPMAQVGTEVMFPREAERMAPGDVHLVFGAPLAPQTDRLEALRVAHARVAALLPRVYAPASSSSAESDTLA